MNKSPKLYLQSVGAILFAFITSSFILFHAPALLAAEVSIQNPSVEQQKIGQLTAELSQLLSRYRRASSEEQSQIEQQLNSIATERQQLLAEVVESNPQTVMKYALPSRVQEQFPTQVQDKFEQWVHAQGEFEIYFEDHERHEKSRLRFYLKQDDQRFLLSVAGDELPVQTSGHNVRVQGVMISKGGKSVIATNDEQIMLAAGGSDDPEITTSIAELPNTLGEQRVAVFLVNFQDDPTNKPWSTTEVHSHFFSRISDFFLEVSYQQTWLTGDVIGWYTLPINSSDTCSMSIADAADAAAIDDGIELSQYDRYVYVFPKNSCSWAGYAQVGGDQTRALINNTALTMVPAHELGHNLGLHHSQGLNCEGDAANTSCVQITYGDRLDTMGGSNRGHFNAYQKERLGWLNNNQSPPIITVDKAGSYAIELYETTTSNAKGLKVFKDIDPVNGLERWYYIEFRQAVGEDQFISSYSFLDKENITNGVTVHMATEGKANEIYLLDMTPESASSSSDLYDPALTYGSSYTDASSGLTITTAYTNDQHAAVYVDYDGTTDSSCTPADPTIDVSPSQSQWVTSGSQVDFTITVNNQDSNACASSTFAINAVLPPEWNANSPQLSLTPGQTGSTVISITSAAEALDAFYDISLSVSNTDNASYSSSTTATYVISSSNDNSAPNAVDDDVTMSSITPIVIDVLSNDSDPDADAIFISAVGDATKGDVSVNSDGTLLYTPAKRFKDTDSFSYTITDGQANDTATAILSLVASSGNDEDSSSGGKDNNGKGGGKPSR